MKELHTTLKKIERYLRRFHIYRSETMSIGDVVSKIQNSSIPRADEICKLLHEYEAIRYRPSPPDKAILNQLSARISEKTQ